jgi:hypothetical protein
MMALMLLPYKNGTTAQIARALWVMPAIKDRKSAPNCNTKQMQQYQRLKEGFKVPKGKLWVCKFL